MAALIMPIAFNKEKKGEKRLSAHTNGTADDLAAKHGHDVKLECY